MQLLRLSQSSGSLSLEYIFESLAHQQFNSEDCECLVKCRYYEIYKENIMDLVKIIFNTGIPRLSSWLLRCPVIQSYHSLRETTLPTSLEEVLGLLSIRKVKPKYNSAKRNKLTNPDNPRTVTWLIFTNLHQGPLY